MDRDDLKEYNGWRNYQTWNVALWIANDEDLYGLAQASAHTDIEAGTRPRYQHFVDTLLFDPGQYALTGDGVRWDDPDLDIAALDDMIAELVEEDRHGLFPVVENS
jgi:hypothetical protein